jgi:hypothetical protein
MSKFLCLLLVTGAISFAQDHPNFSGNWQLDSTKSEGASAKTMALAIQQNDDKIAVTSDEEGKSTSFECATNGQNCKVKGEPAQVSMYYNGPTLVELDMEGHNGEHVIKKRLHISDGGKTMEMEVMRISPPGPSDKLIFNKK